MLCQYSNCWTIIGGDGFEVLNKETVIDHAETEIEGNILRRMAE